MTNLTWLPFTPDGSLSPELNSFFIGFAVGLVWFGFGVCLRLYRRIGSSPSHE